MQFRTISHNPIFSEFADDDDMQEIIGLFVDEMPQRVATLQLHLSQANWSELCRAAHQLKGSAGSHGFSPVTPVAARLENALRQSAPEAEILVATQALIEMCSRLRAGAAT